MKLRLLQLLWLAAFVTFARSAFRFWLDVTSRELSRGFRVVLAAGQP